MKTYEEAKTVQTKSIICDSCNKEFPTNSIEVQEFLNIHFCGGYGSIFGDGNTFECDLCQHCVKKLIGKYFREVIVIE